MTLRELQSVMDDNDTVVRFLSTYINLHPRFLSREMVEDLARECEVSLDLSFRTLFAAACGLDTAEDKHHRYLERTYLNPGIHRLDPTVYQNDAYVKTVRFPHQTKGRWELCEHSYAPYEPFVCNHPVLTPDFCEIPQIGYFAEEFSFPAVLENGIEWMTVTPNEVETMKAPIAKSRGEVLTLGLGLGYFAFHAAEKENVKRVTVVEKDPDVIDLFRTNILPQFPHKEKIVIQKADAFDFMQTQFKPGEFDFVFADLWHDPSDGLDMYLELKKFEPKVPGTAFSYWIEPSLLSVLRHMVFRRLTDPKEPLQLRGVSPEALLSDRFLKTLNLKKAEEK